MWCSVEMDGTNTVIQFAFWARALPIALSALVVIAALGLALSRKRWWIRIAALVVMLPFAGCGGCLGPSIAADRVELSDAGAWQTTGLWFSPTRKGFNFADISEFHISEAGGQRIWTLHWKTGASERLDPGDLWDSCAQDLVIERAKLAGVAMR